MMNVIPEPSQVRETVPDGHVDGSNLIGRRIAAALIDIALLLVLLAVLAVAFGEASVEGGTFSFALGGAGLVSFLALVLLYYLVLEWTIGQTVGKLLVGVRVVHAGGGRPSMWAVAIRTVLRVVDWLPLLYLVGFIAMLSTGSRPRRLGDLAAGTEIVRAVPVRHRRLMAASLSALVVVTLAGSIVYTASNDDEAVQTYHDNGVSFDYPAEWMEVGSQFSADSNADQLWDTTILVSDLDLVMIAAYRLNIPVTAENLDMVKTEFEEIVRQGFEQLGWILEAGPEEITVDGRPGLRFRGNGTVDETPVQSTLVYILDGATEYSINCQFTPARAEEGNQGCEEIVRTFKVGT